MSQASDNAANKAGQKAANSIYSTMEGVGAFFGASSDVLISPLMFLRAATVDSAKWMREGAMGLSEMVNKRYFGEQHSRAQKIGASLGIGVGVVCCIPLAGDLNAAARNFYDSKVAPSTPSAATSCKADEVKAEIEKIKAQGFVVSCPK